MRTLTILTLLVLAIVLGCEPVTKRKTPHVYTVSKIVADKREAEETSYKYKYNFWKGDFYHVPDIHTVYYLIYTDGRYEAVDVGKFSTTNIGDTLTETAYQY